MPTAALPAQQRRKASYLIAGVVTVIVLVAYLLTTSFSAHAASTLISQGKPALASSEEGAGTAAAGAFDGNLTGTRWSSVFSDPQWIRVDLGATANITQIKLYWEAAYATAFKLQSSPDGSTWTDLKNVTGAAGGTQTYDVTGSGRYVRMYGTARVGGYGYSLWEFQVYGDFGGTPSASPSTSAPAGCGTANVAQGKAADASSTENAQNNPASAAVDGNTGTRWSSVFTDPQWLRVDLGSVLPICEVQIQWEAAYGKDFKVQSSTDNTNWTDLKSVTGGTGGNQSFAVSGSGRYVRVYGTARATGYGYSIWEFVVRSGTGTSPSASPSTSPSASPSSSPSSSVPPVTGGGSFGPNVLIYDPSMSGAAIQSSVDSVFAQMESNQFGPQRYALLFKPGVYNNYFNAQIGFYTSIAGLGQNPDDVQLHADVTVDAGWAAGNATQNFWRSAENFSIYPSSGEQRWAVAQAAPYRRVDVHGGLVLAPNGNGWASGGYIADSRISGTVGTYSQQQWFTRDSQVGGWSNAVWNDVFSGVIGAPAQTFPNPPYTTVAQSPIIREKPYLYLDSAGNYQVFVPSLSTNHAGVTWANGNTPGSSIPLTQFYLVKPGDTAAKINQALSQGLNLLFTPGVYHVDQTISVTRPNTVVMGLGLATIVPDNGVTPLAIGDVDGVKLAGLLIDAGTVNSPYLLQVGPNGSGNNHAANPTSIQDVFLRVGGAGPAMVTTAMIVNSSNVIIDHIWSWRADHGAGAGWDSNPADYGLIVNGQNVMAYGLFVEHFKKYCVLWNGNGGRTIFFQNELAYDPPSAAAWTHDGIVGYAAYKVADTVTSHEAWGLGSYCVFTTDPSITVARGFEVPVNAGVKMHNLSVVSLGKGNYAHVINDTGPPALSSAVVPSTVTNFPS